MSLLAAVFLVACASRQVAIKEPFVAAKWAVSGASLSEIRDLHLEDFRVEALVAFRGDSVIATKPDSTPFPELQSAVEEFYLGPNAPTIPEKPGQRLTFVVARTTPAKREFQPGTRHGAVGFKPTIGGLSFDSVLPKVGLEGCTILPTFAKSGATTADLEATLFSMYSSPPFSAKVGKRETFDGHSYRIAEIRKYRESDGSSVEAMMSTLRTTILVSYSGADFKTLSLLPVGRIPYQEGLWIYLDGDGKVQSMPMKDVNWQDGGKNLMPPQIFLTKSDAARKTMTFCTNLIASELKGLHFMDTRRYDAKLTGVALIP